MILDEFDTNKGLDNFLDFISETFSKIPSHMKCENAFLKKRVVVLEAGITAKKNREIEKLEAEVLDPPS